MSTATRSTGGSKASSRSTKPSTNAGSPSDTPSEPCAPALSEVELALVARLLGVGAESVLAVRDAIRVTTPGGVDWRLGPGQWLLVQLPLDGRLPDGAIYRAERTEVNS